MRYTVHSKTDIPNLIPELSVVREHEEFIWLHNYLDNNEEYAGFIVKFFLKIIYICSRRKKIMINKKNFITFFL